MIIHICGPKLFCQSCSIHKHMSVTWKHGSFQIHFFSLFFMNSVSKGFYVPFDIMWSDFVVHFSLFLFPCLVRETVMDWGWSCILSEWSTFWLCFWSVHMTPGWSGLDCLEDSSEFKCNLPNRSGSSSECSWVVIQFLKKKTKTKNTHLQN